MRYFARMPPGPTSSVVLNTAPGYAGSCSMNVPVCTNAPLALQKRSYGPTWSSGRTAVRASSSSTVTYIGAQCTNSGNANRRTSWNGA